MRFGLADVSTWAALPRKRGVGVRLERRIVLREVGADLSLRGEISVSEPSDDTLTASAPRYSRRLSDRILIAFHHTGHAQPGGLAERRRPGFQQSA